MVCSDCEKKLKKLVTMDTWKSGSSNAGVGRGSDAGRRLGENKLLGKKRFGNLSGMRQAGGGMAGGGSKRCRLCKGMLHANQELYCQHCAYKNGLCTMCGKQVTDTRCVGSRLHESSKFLCFAFCRWL